MKIKQRIKLIIVLGIEFLAITVMLLLIFFAGKRVYTVTFDLNGGTLLSGDVVQKVTQGQNANPPTVTKEGCYFLKWSGSFREVTRDITIEAIWEYETSPGIEYTSSPDGYDSNYCEISGCYEGLTGDIYIGAYHDEKKVLGIKENAFANCKGITSIHLLDGILTIEDGAFSGCTNLVSIEMPSTVVRMGDAVFSGCTNLKSIVLPEDLEVMGDGVFFDCTSLEEVTIGEKLEKMGSLVFSGCSSLKEIILPKSLLEIGSRAFDQQDLIIYAYIKEEDKPETWASDWNFNGAEVVWEYEPEEETNEDDKKSDKNNSGSKGK